MRTRGRERGCPRRRADPAQEAHAVDAVARLEHPVRVGGIDVRSASIAAATSGVSSGARRGRPRARDPIDVLAAARAPNSRFHDSTRRLVSSAAVGRSGPPGAAEDHDRDDQADAVAAIQPRARPDARSDSRSATTAAIAPASTSCSSTTAASASGPDCGPTTRRRRRRGWSRRRTGRERRPRLASWRDERSAAACSAVVRARRALGQQLDELEAEAALHAQVALGDRRVRAAR